MKAVRVHAFGGLDAPSYEDMPRRVPGAGQVLVRVMAAGVGPWDAWVREGKSAVPQPLPLVLGSDLSGLVEAIGARHGHADGGCGVWCHQCPLHRRHTPNTRSPRRR